MEKTHNRGTVKYLPCAESVTPKYNPQMRMTVIVIKGKLIHGYIKGQYFVEK